MEGKTIPIYHYTELDPRAGYNPFYSYINMPNVSPYRNTKTAIHEMSHWIEHKGPESILEKSQRFWERRTENDVYEKLRDLTGIAYGDLELTKKDDFISVYMGRFTGRTRWPVA